MKNPKTINEATDQLEKLLKHYFEKIGWKNIEIRKEGECLSEDDSDVRLTIDGWLVVSAFTTKELLPCLFGKRSVDAIHYNVHKEVMIRSFNRDDPDEWDIVDVKLDVFTINQVIALIVHTMIDNDLDAIAENLEMDEMAQEQEDFSKQEGI